ncbi:MULTISPECIES: hypothetical protein [Gammaproteobacteria]|uniref:hypothetical protein n=1 Tax=Gammaproteobacteria TaxID=1236 RepID=UPI000DD0A5CD|nr:MULTISPECIES: hypothetical protein [Gammaproteobacteria]RTE87251.1 hypothetical protein DQX04_02355 [Aliidiomarina sp. B3213]TCZ92962.1 hypothetical protein EYQ95_02950 [Lysobacter sp. N42]
MMKRIGGSPEKALNNDFKLDTNALLQQAWNLTKSTILPLLGALLLIWAISQAGGYLLQSFFDFQMPETPEEFESMVLPTGFVLSMLVLYFFLLLPMQAAMYKMGIRNAAAVEAEYPETYKNKPLMVFNYLSNPFRYGGVELLRGIIPVVALVIGIMIHPFVGFALAGFVAISLQLSTPLVVQDGLNPFKAIGVSFRVIAKNFVPFLVITFVMIVLVFLSALLLFIPLLWFVPMYYNLIGLVYKDVFGIEVEISDQADINTVV